MTYLLIPIYNGEHSLVNTYFLFKECVNIQNVFIFTRSVTTWRYLFSLWEFSKCTNTNLVPERLVYTWARIYTRGKLLTHEHLLLHTRNVLNINMYLFIWGMCYDMNTCLFVQGLCWIVSKFYLNKECVNTWTRFSHEECVDTRTLIYSNEKCFNVWTSIYSQDKCEEWKLWC